MISHIYFYGAYMGALFLLYIMKTQPDAVRIHAQREEMSERRAMMVFFVAYVLLWFLIPVALVRGWGRK